MRAAGVDTLILELHPLPHHCPYHWRRMGRGVTLIDMAGKPPWPMAQALKGPAVQKGAPRQVRYFVTDTPRTL